MCKETFLTTSNLKEHRQLVHKAAGSFSDLRLYEPLISPIRTSKRVHLDVIQCAITLKANSWNGNIIANTAPLLLEKAVTWSNIRSSHTGKKPFICYQCSKQSTSRSSPKLLTHTRIHAIHEKSCQRRCRCQQFSFLNHLSWNQLIWLYNRHTHTK